MGGKGQGSVEEAQVELPQLEQELWNVSPDYSGQMQPFDWSPLNPNDPKSYQFTEQSTLGPQNAQANQFNFELLMDDLTNRIQARIDADRQQMGDIGWSNNDNTGF